MHPKNRSKNSRINRLINRFIHRLIQSLQNQLVYFIDNAKKKYYSRLSKQLMGPNTKSQTFVNLDNLKNNKSVFALKQIQNESSIFRTSRNETYRARLLLSKNNIPHVTTFVILFLKNR